jgi:hypothetical protein
MKWRRPQPGRPAAYVDRGELGVKSGKGSYRHPNPTFARPGFTETAAH